jgi:hypothetical protein
MSHGSEKRGSRHHTFPITLTWVDMVVIIVSLPDSFLSHCSMVVEEVGPSYTPWKARPLQKEQTRSDTLRRDRVIREACIQGSPGQPIGLVARPLLTLAALSSGLVGRQSTPLPKGAPHVPDGATPASHIKRFARGATTPTAPPSALLSRMPRACGLSLLDRRWCWSSGVAWR